MSAASRRGCAITAFRKTRSVRSRRKRSKTGATSSIRARARGPTWNRCTPRPGNGPGGLLEDRISAARFAIKQHAPRGVERGPAVRTGAFGLLEAERSVPFTAQEFGRGGVEHARPRPESYRHFEAAEADRAAAALIGKAPPQNRKSTRLNS